MYYICISSICFSLIPREHELHRTFAQAPQATRNTQKIQQSFEHTEIGSCQATNSVSISWLWDRLHSRPLCCLPLG